MLSENKNNIFIGKAKSCVVLVTTKNAPYLPHATYISSGF
jgi:hypothetical protein